MMLTLSMLSRLTSLRLEAWDLGWQDHAEVTKGISSLSSLEKLYIDGFAVLGSQPAEVAAALQPLHRLRALVGGRSARPAA